MGYNAKTVRDLVQAALGSEELADLCFSHFRPVYEEFTSGQSNSQRIRALVEYAFRQREVDKLLRQIEGINPAAYAEFVPGLPNERASARPEPPPGINVFFSYSHLDESLRNELEAHLAVLKRQGAISTWHNRAIGPGTNWDQAIDEFLSSADIILLLVSSDFLASDYCFDVEMKRALKRHESGDARVVPLILRPSDWQQAPFGELQALPTNGRPVTAWENRDEAWVDVTRSLRLVCEELRRIPTGKRSPDKTQRRPPTEDYRLVDVFKKSGIPEITFVEPEQFSRVKLAIEQPGRGVVIEGPTGIGKTTILHKGLEQLKRDGRIESVLNSERSIATISARKPDELENLSRIRKWHKGIVAIDDFPRLARPLQQQIADYLKELADLEDPTRKLIIIGIPRIGQALVELAFDVTNRIDVFRLHRVSNEKVLEMIGKGEDALNVTFERRNDICVEAAGSLNIAQTLCYEICAEAGIQQTQSKRCLVNYRIEDAVKAVLDSLTMKFHEPLRRFVAMGGPGDGTCLNLLLELAQSVDGAVSLGQMMDRRRDLAEGIKRFLAEQWMDNLCRQYPVVENYLFLDDSINELVGSDPQLTFFLRNAPFRQLARDAGKAEPQQVSRSSKNVLLTFSHKDKAWMERLLPHFVALERNQALIVMDDIKSNSDTNWIDDVKGALNRSSVMISLLSPDYLTSGFCLRNEVRQLVQRREGDGGMVFIPVLLRPCAWRSFSWLADFQVVPNGSEAVAAQESDIEMDKIFANLAERVFNLANVPIGTPVPKEFDVFLSHNSKDKSAVRELARALQRMGVKVWLDEEQLIPGRPWQEALEDIIETARTAAILVGRDGMGPWEDREMRACLSEFVDRGFPVIPVLLPDAPKKPKLPLFLKQFTWVDLRGGLIEAGLERLTWGIIGTKPTQRSL